MCLFTPRGSTNIDISVRQLGLETRHFLTSTGEPEPPHQLGLLLECTLSSHVLFHSPCPGQRTKKGVNTDYNCRKRPNFLKTYLVNVIIHVPFSQPISQIKAKDTIPGNVAMQIIIMIIIIVSIVICDYHHDHHPGDHHPRFCVCVLHSAHLSMTKLGMNDDSAKL